MRNKRRNDLAVLGLAMLISVQCFAQGVDPAKFAEIQKGNSQALKSYLWKQRFELQLKGETKKVTVNMVRYDAQGNEQKTPLSEEPQAQQQQQPAAPGGRGSRVKAKVVENKKEEFKEMMEGLAGLVKSYAQIPPDKLKAAMAKAEKIPGQGEMQGALGLKLANLLQDKDSLTIWIDTGTMLFRRIEIASSYDKKPVSATANYEQINTGPNYMAKAVLQYPSKEVVVKIDNFDYQPTQ
jgi:hypothetical protein